MDRPDPVDRPVRAALPAPEVPVRPSRRAVLAGPLVPEDLPDLAVPEGLEAQAAPEDLPVPEVPEVRAVREVHWFRAYRVAWKSPSLRMSLGCRNHQSSP